MEATANIDPVTANLKRMEVPRLLSDEQVRSYVEDGFLIVEDVITPEEREEILADIVKLVRGGYPCPSLTPASDSMTDKEVMESFSGIMQPHIISPVITEYIKHKRICGMLSQLLGAHIPYWDGSIKCMQSMVFVKPPGFPGQAWHQDELYIPTKDRSLCGAWIALDDATVENGCLWVIPGSHRSGYFYPQRKHDRAGEWDWAPESYGFDDSGAVPAEVRTSGAVFFNGYILHGSYKNRSNIYRRAIVNHYMNAWSLWGFNHEGDSRRIVHAAGIDPYEWKGYELGSPENVWVRPIKQRDTDKPKNNTVE